MRERILAKIPWAEQPVWRSIDCGDGWLDLVEILVDLAIVYDIKVLQIKEKFGGLRFYCDPFNAKMHKAISAISYLADHTCELCGEAGDDGYDENNRIVWKATKNADGYIQTLCTRCRENK